jgi:multidrug resistance protein
VFVFRFDLLVTTSTNTNAASDGNFNPPLRKSFYAVVPLGIMLAPLNATMVAVALTSVASDLEVSIGSVTWIFLAYLIGMTVAQPVSGKLGDLFGRRSLFLWSLVGVFLASLGAALAPNLGVLIFFRVLQAFTGAMAIPNGTAMLRERIPEHRRGAAFGLVGAAAGLSVMLGPPLGAALLALGGWRWIFWINMPLAAAVFVLAVYALPHEPRRVRQAFSLDVRGAALLAAAMTALALMSRSLGNDNVGLPIGLGLGSVFLGGLFIANERRVVEPVVDLGLLRIPSFAAAITIVTSSNLFVQAILIGVPLLIIEFQGKSTSEAGLVLVAFAAPVALLAPLGGRLADRWGRRTPAVLGGVITTAGLAPLIAIGEGWSSYSIAGLLAVVGVGAALQLPSVQASSVDVVSERVAGMASGFFSTGRYFGNILGVVVIAAVLGADPGGTEVTVGRLGVIFGFAVAGAAISTAGAFYLKRRPVEGLPEHSAPPASGDVAVTTSPADGPS